MPVVHLTDLAIRSLPEGIFFDDRKPSFGILIGKRTKTWLVVKGRRRVREKIGHYPALSLADARRRATMILAETEEEKPSSPLFSDARAMFLEKHGVTLRPRSLYQLKGNLHRHFSWDKPLDKVTHNDVAKALEAIQGPSQRAHALKDIRTFFNWCIPRYLALSPCIGLKKPPEKSRERTLNHLELKAVWKKAEEIGYPYGTIVRLLILTGQRAGEITALRREWISATHIAIPGEFTKNARPSTIPLGALAKALIDDCPDKTELLFPARGHTNKPFQGLQSRKVVLDQCGVKNFTHHDLRRTFATNLAALGTPIHVTEKLLNHVSGTVSGVAAIYNRHSYMEEMRVAVDVWEKRLAAILADNEPDA